MGEVAIFFQAGFFGTFGVFFSHNIIKKIKERMFFMRKTKTIALMLAASVCLASTGCSSQSASNSTESEYAYLKKLSNNTFYILNSSNECTPVFMPDITFEEGSTPSTPSDRRVVWFKDTENDKIPTLYAGDSLIFKTSGVLDETFHFERFEDLGYSVGICGLSETESGRYSLSTDPDKNNTYPYGDTDVLLTFKNSTLILDSLGGVDLRVPEKTENGISLGGSLSRAGTITGLSKGKKYLAQVYSGTELHEYEFTADVRILASMETYKTTDFNFESETVIKINIPESFNNGYYMINGKGLFRYVAGDSYDENTNFNIPNETEEGSSASSSSSTSSSGSSDSSYTGSNFSSTSDYEPPDTQSDLSQSMFTLDQTGVVTVKANVSGTPSASVTGYIVSPSQKRYAMSKTGESLEITFEVSDTGDYMIELYNLGDATADINVSYIENY